MMSEYFFEQLLRLYGLTDSVSIISSKLIKKQTINGEERFVYKVVTGDVSYIVKMTNESKKLTNIIDKQSRLSENFRDQGEQVALLYAYEKDKFCHEVNYDEKKWRVILQQYVGSEYRCETAYDYYKLGRTLGRLHKCSLSNQIQVGLSYLYKELVFGNISFAKIWDENESYCDEIDSMIPEMSKLHNQTIAAVRDIWKDLPRAGVHGDLGFENNLSNNNHSYYTVYDFGMAGDEVLLGDFLMTWMGSVYTLKYKYNVKMKTIASYWQQYLRGYEDERLFTDLEKKNSFLCSKLFENLYCTKYALLCLKNNRFEEGLKALYDAKDVLCKENISFVIA